MGVSKVVYGDNTIIDLTSDTVDADSLLSGVTAHGKDGEEIVGTLVYNDLDLPLSIENGGTGSTTADEALNALGAASKTDLEAKLDAPTTPPTEENLVLTYMLEGNTWVRPLNAVLETTALSISVLGSPDFGDYRTCGAYFLHIDYGYTDAPSGYNEDYAGLLYVSRSATNNETVMQTVIQPRLGRVYIRSIEGATSYSWHSVDNKPTIGNTVSIDGWYTGYTTSSASIFRFTIPCNHNHDSISSYTAVSWSATMRQDTNYPFGRDPVSIDSADITITSTNDSAIKVTIDIDDYVTGVVTNNSVAALTLAGTVKFS